MSKLVDCPSCGGLIPAERRCCPHCHCKSSIWKHWFLLISAALGLRAAGCDSQTVVTHYGGSMIFRDAGAPDMAVPDVGPGDAGAHNDGGDGGQ